jgi:hypothetical protein
VRIFRPRPAGLNYLTSRRADRKRSCRPGVSCVELPSGSRVEDSRSSAPRRPEGQAGSRSRRGVRRCPTLPQGHPCSTIGAESLSFRVRNVTGRFPLAMAAETLLMFRVVHTNGVPVHREPQSGREQQSCDSYALSTEGVCCQVIGLLVPVSCTGL